MLKNGKAYEDIIGEKFGKLTVISFNSYKKPEYYYDCLCDCGNFCIVSRTNLRCHRTRSCGCLVKENKKHIYKAIDAHKKVLENQVCAYCGKAQIYAKGLCRSCYDRMRNRNTCEYYTRKNLTLEEKKELHKNNRVNRFSPNSEIGKELLKKMIDGVSIKNITNEYNISKTTLYNILNNKYKRR